MQKLKSKRFWLDVFAFLIGVVGITLVVFQVCRRGEIVVRYKTQEQSYSKDATPTALALLTYFTNITLLLFSVYAVVRFFAVLFGLRKLSKALDNRYLLMFMAINELAVFFIYTLMLVFAFNFPMPKHKMTPYNLHQKWSSVFKHFFITLFAGAYCFDILKNETKKIEIKKCLWFILYPLVYYVVVQIIGRTCYEFKWFPYPFFAADQIWLKLFGTLKNFNYGAAILLLAVCLFVVLLVYILVMVVCIAIYGALQRKNRSRFVKEVIYAKTEN